MSSRRLSALRTVAVATVGALALGVFATEAQAIEVFAVDNLGTNNAGTVGDRVIRFDTTNPLGTVTTVGATNTPGLAFSGLDFAPSGVLYGVSGFGSAFTGSSLYTISTTNGVATLVGSTGLPSNQGLTDLSFNPVTGQMQGITGAGALFNISLTTGAATLIGQITGLPGTNLEIGLSTNAAGVNFVHNLSDDRMYQVVGLVATPMTATIGIDTNFSQGMTIDWSRDGSWYLGSISNTPVFASQVRLMNNVTGGTQSILATWPNNGGGGLPQYETGDLAIFPIPEPASLSLLALAGLGLIRRRTR